MLTVKQIVAYVQSEITRGDKEVNRLEEQKAHCLYRQQAGYETITIQLEELIRVERTKALIYSTLLEAIRGNWKK